MGLFLEKVVVGPFETNAYFMGCEKEKKAVIIDPGLGSFSSLMHFAKAGGFDVEKIIITHSHLDHFADASFCKEATKALVFVHLLDQNNLQNPGSDGLGLFMPVRAVSVDGVLEDGQEITVGTLKAVVLHTPGHSPGSICLYFPDQAIVFTGDTLFKGTFGNVSFPHSSKTDMMTSLKRLYLLPKNTVVYPGHGESSTITQESWIGNAITKK